MPCSCHNHNTSQFLVGFLGSLMSLVIASATPAGAGTAMLVKYVSPLDDSTQEYGVYLPAAPAPTIAGHPAIFHMHGYGWAVSADFSDWQRKWADEHGWILINLNARGPQFYEGVGDVETRNVVRDAHQRFGLNLDRLYATGGSMGGTGAFRHGVRYPDIFAAVVGVDGWSDFREWHWHWYARADQRDQIEEFRRPLLEACSPYYWAGRARWGHIQAAVSGQDDVVLPENGLSLYNALLALATERPGAYDARLFLDYGAGHGGATRLDEIYAYFSTRSRIATPTSFRLDSTLLTHGTLYWGSLDRFTVQGATGVLEVEIDGATVSVQTSNLDGFSLYLQASPVATQSAVQVYVDGFLAYEGIPHTVHFNADRGGEGVLWGWEVGEAASLRKTATLEGPIGDAFRVPFVVVYGTAGNTQQTTRHRQEAEAFAQGWNDFMVHDKAVQALPETKLAPADLNTKSLILFGAEDTSQLLREITARKPLPVGVRSDGIIVRDRDYGNREYLGAHYGAFVCYPNPLNDDKTYLVVCQGQWATQPDGSMRQGLEYDLEKLPWAYSDYVVFNTDITQLPHVLNVNNKPPVTCYEAGYFVEAGWFDQDWQPCRSITLDRVLKQELKLTRIHVAEVACSVIPEPPVVLARIVDGEDLPFAQARVTVRINGTLPRVHSTTTDADGYARFSVSETERQQGIVAEVVNVDATGAVYDFRADEMTSTVASGLGLKVDCAAVDESALAKVIVTAGDWGALHDEVLLQVEVPTGIVTPAVVAVDPGKTSEAVTFTWDVAKLTPGIYRCQLIAKRASGLTVCRPFVVRVLEWPEGPLRLVEVKAADIVAGNPYQIKARLLNLSTQESLTANLACALVTARRYLQPRSVTILPGEEVEVTWMSVPDEVPLAPGLHTVRVIVLGQRGLTETATFVAR